MNRRLALIVTFFAAAPALAQPPPEGAAIRGESPPTRKRLADADQKRLAGKSAEALEDLLRIMDDAGDDLVRIEPSRYVSTRRFAQQMLAKLPAASLAIYRDRVEESARTLLERGTSRRDPRPLEELLERYANSRPAEAGLWLLGELAFERGEFSAAERHWRRLLPEASEDPYPQPAADPAIVKAKVLLAVIYQGDRIRANALLLEFGKAHPALVGRLAGRDGKFAEILQTLLNEMPVVPNAVTAGWAGFGNGPHRDGRAAAASKFLPAAPLWKTAIPRAAEDATRPVVRAAAVGAVRSVAFHPVVVGETAYLADASRILAFDLTTGSAAVAFDLRKEKKLSLPTADLTVPVPYDADFTLTAANGRLYARLGPAALFPNGEDGTATTSAIACFDLPAKLRWLRTPPVGTGVAAGWEGAPIVVDGRILAVFVRSDGGKVIHALACYDDRSERPLWVTDLCETGGGAADAKQRHELLTLAGANVVFCSQSGAIVAVNARSGKPAWAFRYPRVKKTVADGRFRDLGPPVSSAGRVFVAPTDSDHLYAFDADSGRVLWQDDNVLVDHILGVAAGKVVCAISGPVRGLRAYAIPSGSTAAPDGWMNHDDPGLSSFGRGFVSDEFVFWPSTAGLYTLRLKDGLPARAPLRGPHGNLAAAAGIVLVATPAELWAYRTDGKAAPTPGNPLTAIDLAPLGRQTITAAANDDLRPVLQTPVTATRPAEVRRDVQGRCLAHLDDHHIAGVDAESGRIRWLLDFAQHRHFWPHALQSAPRFSLNHYSDDARSLVQLSTGRRWLIDAQGQVVQDAPTALNPWPTPPVRLDADHLAVADGPATVTAIRAVDGRPVWTFDAGREASLRGNAAGLRRLNDALAVAIERNIGVELELLNARDGQRLWKAPAFLTAVDLAACDADAERLFVPQTDRVAALRLANGRTSWETALPFPAPWAAVSAANVVIVYPTTALRVDPAANALRGFMRRPLVERLVPLLGDALEAELDRVIPVIVLDPVDGRVQQRLDLSARGFAVTMSRTVESITLTCGENRWRLK